MSFDENGDRIFVLATSQIRGGEYVPVGEYSPYTDEIKWFVDESTLFIGKECLWFTNIYLYQYVSD